MRGSIIVGLCVAAATLAVPSTRALACNAGTYFDGDTCSRCPGGTFGDVPGLTSRSCSGLCDAGFFCPEGSTSPRQRPCGTSTYYCPPGSAERRRVDDGYYTTTFPQTKDDSLMVDSSKSGAGSQIRCEKGFYCVFGIRRACPPGTFGDSTRVTTSDCSGLCPKGSYCPAATNVPIPCPAGTFGGDLGLATAQCSGPCPIGHFCVSGTVVPTPCPMGTFSQSLGLTTAACSSSCSTIGNTVVCIPSPCPAGFYCPIGTPIPLECGSVGVFCPQGSSSPTTATQGYYTTWKAYWGASATGERLELQYVEGYSVAALNQTTRTNQHICEKGSYCIGGVKRLCPGGTYGSQTGLFSAGCTAPCPAGYFCPEGTSDYSSHPCLERTSFCRLGSPIPKAVDSGYFTVASALGVRIDETVCPTGSYCIGGVKYRCPEGTFGSTTGLSSIACSGKCQDGYVCPRGSIAATQSPCPAGSYSRNGRYCSPCSPGYWCGAASPDPHQHTCGGDTVYCPLGSAAAQPVLHGYYAVGQQQTTHTAAVFCVIKNAPHLPQCPTRTVV